MSKSKVVIILFLGFCISLSIWQFGCGEKASPLHDNESTQDIILGFFLIAIILIIVVWIIYVLIRDKIEESFLQMQKKINEYDSILGRQSERIKWLGNQLVLMKKTDIPTESKCSVESWNLVIKGMEQDEIIKVLGTPTALYPTPEGEMYFYGKEDIEGQIFFVDGKVTYYSKPGFYRKLTDLEMFKHLYDESFSAKDQNKKTERQEKPKEQETELLEKIEKGMTEDEVIKLLGKPHQIEPFNDKEEIWRYGPPYSNSKIQFLNGKVIGFQKNCNA